eukprot:1399034-Rhodomonas_salina.2
MNSVRAALLCIICVTLFAPARLQQCSSSLIAWPPEQCTRSCPERIDCNRQESIRVRKGDVEYCCVCVEYGIGTYESKLCPASALPKPQSPQVREGACMACRRPSCVHPNVVVGHCCSPRLDFAAPACCT